MLTTEQIAAAEFTSVRRAQDRLRILRQLGVLFAFRDSFAGGGTSPNRYALGYLGTRLIAAQREQAPPTPAAHRLALERLAASPRLPHLLGTNQFFCDLIAYARRAALSTGDQAVPESPALTVWLPEQLAADRLEPKYSVIRPDGYEQWTEHGRTVGFYLEHDTGTESLTKVTDKIIGYHEYDLADQDVLLFSVHSTRRESALRAALPAALRRSYADAARENRHVFDNLTIATAPRDHGHPDRPAGPVWASWTPDDPHQTALTRYRLAELPLNPRCRPDSSQSTAPSERPKRCNEVGVVPPSPTPPLHLGPQRHSPVADRLTTTRAGAPMRRTTIGPNKRPVNDIRRHSNTPRCLSPLRSRSSSGPPAQAW